MVLYWGVWCCIGVNGDVLGCIGMYRGVWGCIGVYSVV